MKPKTMIEESPPERIQRFSPTEVNAIDYKVRLERLNLSDGTPTSAHASVREDNGEILGIVGDRYHIVPNLELFEQVEAVIARSGHEYKPAGYEVIDGGRQVRAKFRFPNLGININPNDRSTLQIAIQNSFDGSLKVSLDLGFFRILCSNGMKVPSFQGSAVSLMKKHTQQVDSVFASAALAHAFGQVEQAREIFSTWSRVSMPQASGHKVLNGLVKAGAFTARVSDGIREIWDKPTHREDEARTVWNLYNAVTQYATHEIEPTKFALAQRIGQETVSALRIGVAKGIESLYIDSLPERKSKGWNTLN